MTKLTLTAAALVLAACGSGPDIRPADVADLGSTAAFLATGNGVEANQLIAGASTAETLVRGGVLKLGARAAINEIPMEDRTRENMHTFMDATGYGAAASNIHLAITASPAPWLGAAIGLGYFIYNYEQGNENE